MFKKSITDNRQEMMNFLKNHFCYHFANPWNNIRSYANCVKLYKLNLPADVESKAYDFICAECEEYDAAIRDLIEEFEFNTGQSVFFNGRSDGYIVLCTTEGRPVFFNQDEIEEMDLDELKDYTNDICAFDELCDDIRETFIRFVKETTVTNETYTVIKTKRVARLTNES